MLYLELRHEQRAGDDHESPRRLVEDQPVNRRSQLLHLGAMSQVIGVAHRTGLRREEERWRKRLDPKQRSIGPMHS